MKKRKNKILITGATGGLGSKVVSFLKEKKEVENIAVLVRDEKNELAKQYKNDGIEVKTGDYAKIESLAKAFQGIDILYFVSGGEDNKRSELHKNVVDVAKESGIKHILYTSGVRKDRSNSSPLAALMDSHIKTELFIRASGMAYTFFRHNLYAEVIGMLIGNKNQLLKTKTIYLPAANGMASFVPKNDLAEAEVQVLLNPYLYENKILEFNGSERMAFSEIAGKLTEIMGEPIRYISTEVTEFKAMMNKLGLPNEVVEMLSAFSLAIAQGEFDQQSNDLKTILGRTTQPLSEFLQESYK